MKAELRETAFNMWMACYSAQEIADGIGYSDRVIRKFIDSIQNRENGTDADSPFSSENPTLTESEGREREFDCEENDEDSNRLGVYMLDKRLLIKANHMDEYFKPPIYNKYAVQYRIIPPQAA